MTKKGNEQHEKELQRACKELRSDGWKVIDLEGRSPDAIAVKEEKVVAVEVLMKYKIERNDNDHRRYRWKFSGGFTLTQKKNIYKMFDDVLFFFYLKEKN